jgi:DNA-binding transcriptional ArsR family regulator
MNDSDLVFRAPADPNRRMLLDALNAKDAQTLTELCEYLEMTPAAQYRGLQLRSAVVTQTHLYAG